MVRLLHPFFIRSPLKHQGLTSSPWLVGFKDAHNEFERSLAAFLGQPSAILCAQDFACVTSVIPSFAKRGDYLIVDSLVNFAVLKGCQVSRSIIRFYKHGDMSSLEQVLESVDREARRKDKLTRRFIVTEGLFEYDGWICNLERIVALKKKYKARLILDESYSLGVLGATGRGVTELWGVSVRIFFYHVSFCLLTDRMSSDLSTGV